MQKMEVVHAAEYRQAERRVHEMQSELIKIEEQIAAQHDRLLIAQKTAERFSSLDLQRFVSREVLQQHESEVLDQKLRLQTLERDHMILSRELNASKSELNAMPLKSQNQVSALGREIRVVSQELAENEAKRGLNIRAPGAGIVSEIVADIGQLIDPSRAVANIIPKDSVLQAHLYAPSKSVGFIKEGDSVLLRYQAYPYQKFGQAKGKVKFVSKTSLVNSEIPAFVNKGDSFYRVTVELESQIIFAYESKKTLLAGMVVEGDVMQETRNLYEWIFEPILGFARKI
jgi:membrane fusion protein